MKKPCSKSDFPRWTNKVKVVKGTPCPCVAHASRIWAPTRLELRSSQWLPQVPPSFHHTQVRKRNPSKVPEAKSHQINRKNFDKWVRNQNSYSVFEAYSYSPKLENDKLPAFDFNKLCGRSLAAFLVSCTRAECPTRSASFGKPSGRRIVPGNMMKSSLGSFMHNQQNQQTNQNLAIQEPIRNPYTLQLPYISSPIWKSKKGKELAVLESIRKQRNHQDSANG